MTFNGKNLILGFAACVPCLATSFSIHAAEAPVTLDECIAIALSENPTVRIADMEVSRADYSKKETLGQLLPTIDFSANYSRTVAKQTMYMNMDGFGDFGGASGDDSSSGVESRASSKGDGGIKVGLDNSYSMGFSATLPLIAPQLWKSMSISDSQILKNVEQARSSRLSLVNEVKSAYYTLLLAEDSRRVIQESYDMAKLNYDVYSKKYAAGAASDYDVLRTSVAMKNIEPELLQADIAIKQARLQLLILMGLDASVELTAATRLADYEGSMYETVLNINPDYSNNPQLVMNTIDTKLASQTVALQKLAFVPTLAFTANYNWTSMSNGSPLKNFRWNPYSMVGLSLSVPLFQGGSRYSRVKQAEVQLLEMGLQRENLERTVAMQVTMAIDNIKINVRQIASCAESVKEADRAHTIMEKSFEIGAAAYLDLRDSELALTRARLAYYQAIYNYLVANSELELLLGTAPLEQYTSSSNK